MTGRPLRVMFVGTCRMHDPAHVLHKDERFTVRTTPHRFHTAAQTLQFVRHMKRVEEYRSEAAHLISDYASKRIYEDGATRKDLLYELHQLRPFWQSCDAFVVELSAIRENYASVDGSEITVNNFSARDQRKYADRISSDAEAGLSLPLLDMRIEPVSPSTTHKRMAEIRRFLARPIIWVSHQRPPSRELKYDVVNKVRSHLADTLRHGAEALGDMFFDPSIVAKEMGQPAFFQKNGEDLDHLTPAAAMVLAHRYGRMVHSVVRA